MIGGETLTDRRIEEKRLRCDVCVKRQVRPELRLNESVGPKQLVKCREWLERRCARSEAPRAVSAWNQESALKAQDRSAVQVGVHHALDAQGRIANAAVPDMVLILKLDRYIHLDLVVHSKPLFVDDVSFVSRRAIRIDRSRNNLLVFGISLLSHQRARKIEFSARPAFLAAKRAQVCNEIVHVLRT